MTQRLISFKSLRINVFSADRLLDDGRAWVGISKEYGLALLGCIALTLMGLPFRHSVEADVISMLFLAGTVIIAAKLGMGPALLTSIVCVFSLNFFFIEPYYSLRFYDSYAFVTLSLLLLTSLVVGSLTARLRMLAKRAKVGENEAKLLYELTKTLTSQTSEEAIYACATTIISATLGTKVTFISPATAEEEAVSDAYDRLALDHALTKGEVCGRGSERLASAKKLYVPLLSEARALSVMSLSDDDGTFAFLPKDILLLQACGEVISSAISLIRSRESAYRAQSLHDNEALRTVLLSSLSHDLRTPLTLMNARISTIIKQRKKLPRETVDEVTKLWNEMNRLQSFVSNLLRITALSSGQMALNFEAISLTEVLGSVYERFAPHKAQRQITTEVKGMIPMVKADGALIEQVIINLIDNAIKYTSDTGKIIVKIEQASDAVSVSISDNGPGIDNGMEMLIFDSFHTSGKRGSDRHKSSTGLGLAICHHIVNAHNGTIGVTRDAVLGGACFTFTLPIWQLNDA